MLLPTLILFLGLAMADDPTPAPFFLPPEVVDLHVLRCYHFATASQAEAQRAVQERKWMILQIITPQNEGQAASHRDAVAAVTAEMRRLDEVIVVARTNLARIEDDVLFATIHMVTLSEEFCSALTSPVEGQ